MSDVIVSGVGMHPFGRFDDKSAVSMGVEALQEALADAGMRVAATSTRCSAHTCTPGPARATRSPPSWARTGIPIINVENACSSGGAAVHGGPPGARRRRLRHRGRGRHREDAARVHGHGLLRGLAPADRPRGQPGPVRVRDPAAHARARDDRAPTRSGRLQEPRPLGPQREGDVPQGVHGRGHPRVEADRRPAAPADAVHAQRGRGGGGPDQRTGNVRRRADHRPGAEDGAPSAGDRRAHADGLPGASRTRA